MKKVLLGLATCLALTSVQTMAQKGRISGGLELALPMGDFGDNAGFGFGASGRYEHPIGDKMGITATLGYITFAKKTFDTGFGKYEYKSSMIPIQAGFKYYFKEAQDGFYVMAEVGVHLFTAKVTSPDFTFFGVTVAGTKETSSNTYLSYAPAIGYHLANIDLGLRYQLFSYETTVSSGTSSVTKTSTASYLGIRAAYVFGEK